MVALFVSIGFENGSGGFTKSLRSADHNENIVSWWWNFAFLEHLPGNAALNSMWIIKFARAMSCECMVQLEVIWVRELQLGQFLFAHDISACFIGVNHEKLHTILSKQGGLGNWKERCQTWSTGNKSDSLLNMFKWFIFVKELTVPIVFHHTHWTTHGNIVTDFEVVFKALTECTTVWEFITFPVNLNSEQCRTFLVQRRNWCVFSRY